MLVHKFKLGSLLAATLILSWLGESSPTDLPLSNGVNEAKLPYHEGQSDTNYAETSSKVHSGLENLSYQPSPEPDVEISHPYSLDLPPPNKLSELAIMLPEFFRFMESMILIMSSRQLRSPYPYYNYNSPPSPIPTSSDPGFYSSSAQLPEEFNPYQELLSTHPYYSMRVNPPLSQTYPNINEIASRASGVSESEVENSNSFEPLKSLQPATHLNKYCVFQGISPLNPNDCQKYLVCFPVKFNMFYAYVAECPEDKKFSTIYRRCVQPYLVPECSRLWYLSPHPQPQNSKYPNVEIFDPKSKPKNDVYEEPLSRPIKDVKSQTVKNSELEADSSEGQKYTGESPIDKKEDLGLVENAIQGVHEDVAIQKLSSDVNHYMMRAHSDLSPDNVESVHTDYYPTTTQYPVPMLPVSYTDKLSPSPSANQSPPKSVESAPHIVDVSKGPFYDKSQNFASESEPTDLEHSSNLPLSNLLSPGENYTILISQPSSLGELNTSSTEPSPTTTEYPDIPIESNPHDSLKPRTSETGTKMSDNVHLNSGTTSHGHGHGHGKYEHDSYEHYEYSHEAEIIGKVLKETPYKFPFPPD